MWRQKHGTVFTMCDDRNMVLYSPCVMTETWYCIHHVWRQKHGTVFTMCDDRNMVLYSPCVMTETWYCIHHVWRQKHGTLLYPPQTLFVGGILFSRCPCVRPSVRNAFVSLITRRVIAGFSSNLANMFIYARQIL